MMKKLFLLGLIMLVGLAANAQAAQGTLSPDKLLVLIVGPSSTRIHPDESQVVQRLNQLRGQNGLDQMQLATIHFDQPAQAKLCRQKLGIQSTDLVAVSLVELDANGNPKRSLYTVPRVTGATLDQLQGTLTQWSRFSGVPMRSPTLSDGLPVRDETMTAEGILATAARLESLTQALWEQVRNEPLRDDQSDRAVRRALLGLAENSRLLRHALEQGNVNPRDQFQLVMANAREWTSSEPQLTLPVRFRGQVPSINEALSGVKQAWLQLNPGQL